MSAILDSQSRELNETSAVTDSPSENLEGVSIVIPAFNEAASMGDVVKAVFRTMEEYGQPFEVVVVDDASQDDTGAKAAEAGAKVVRHASQKGYGAAIKSGVAQTRLPLIAIIDADFQYDPADIPALVDEMPHCEMCVGLRNYREGGAMTRRPGKWVMTRFAQYLVGTCIPDLNSGSRVIRRSRFEKIQHLLPDGFSLSTTSTMALLRTGCDIIWHPIRYAHRRTGRSEVKLFSTGFSTLLLMVRVTMLFAPMRVFLPLSFACFTLAAIKLVLDIIAWNISGTTVLFGVAGLLIFCFGLLADQVAAIRREMKL